MDQLADVEAPKRLSGVPVDDREVFRVIAERNQSRRCLHYSAPAPLAVILAVSCPTRSRPTGAGTACARTATGSRSTRCRSSAGSGSAGSAGSPAAGTARTPNDDDSTAAPTAARRLNPRPLRAAGDEPYAQNKAGDEISKRDAPQAPPRIECRSGSG